MKHRLVVMFAAMVGWVQSDGAAAVTHYSKTVSLVEVATSDCYFFKLEGVGEADPAVANSPWFSILKTQSNSKEMFALLLAVRSTGATLYRIETTGQVACGHAQVAHIDY